MLMRWCQAGGLLCLVLCVASATPAQANHCVAGQPCPKLFPDFHPHADQGWYWVCDWSDGLHYSCSESRADTDIDKLQLRLQDVFRGSCEDFREYIANIGIYDPAGVNHPGRAGQTAESLKWDPNLGYNRSVTAGANGKTKVCRTLTKIEPNFYFDTDMNVSKWYPPTTWISSVSDAANLTFDRNLVVHEEGHVAVVKQIANDANSTWDTGAFQPTACIETATADDGDRVTDAAMKKAASDYIKGKTADILAKADAADKQYDATARQIPPIYCSLPQ